MNNYNFYGFPSFKTRNIDELNRSGTSCKDCNAIYKGKSGRSLKANLTKHVNSVNHSSSLIGLSERCINFSYRVHIEKVQLLHFEAKGKN